MKHDSTHRQRLLEVMTGADATTDLGTCHECLAELAELRVLERGLRADAHAEELERLAAQREATTADEAAVLAALEHGRRSARRPRLWRLRLLALALAASFFAVFLLHERNGEPTPRATTEVLLGGDFPLHVSLAGARYDAVAWEHELLPGESFELSVAALEGSGVGPTLATFTGLTETRFVLPPELEHTLPETIALTVRVRSALGGVEARASATASRR